MFELPEPFIGPLQEQAYLDISEKFGISLDSPLIHEIAPYSVNGHDTLYIALALLRARDVLRNSRVDKTGAMAEQVFRTEFRNEIQNLEQHHERFKDNNQGILIVSLDLLGFTSVNEQHGHLAGDDLMSQVVAYFRTITRAKSGDIVARMGGDEFILKFNFNMQEISKEEFLEIIENRLLECPIGSISLFNGFKWNHAFHESGFTDRDLYRAADIKGDNLKNGYVRSHKKTVEENKLALAKRLSHAPALSN